MKDIQLSQILQMQQALLAAHADDWRGANPALARETMLWMVEELGEAAAIIKKKGDEAIMREPNVRGPFVEELCDIMMYFSKVMLCYGITAEEFAQAFHRKHAHNMTRDFAAQNAAFFNRMNV